MAPVHTTSSPRDHAADANPDLARKKQRFSDEETGTSTDGSIVIEACEPEDIGANIENAIEIDDDLGLIMDSYSNVFEILLDPSCTPYEQLGYLLNDLRQNSYIDPDVFVRLAKSLDQHVAETVIESGEWKQHYLHDEADFFARLAMVAIHLLDGGDLFEPGLDIDTPVMRDAVTAFLTGVEALSRRIIPLLPEAIKGTLSRRDSAQISTGQQSLGALSYLMAAQRILTTETNTLHHFRSQHPQMRLEAAVTQNCNNFFREDIVRSLATVIRALSGSVREIKEAWLAMQQALALFRSAITKRQLSEYSPSEEIEEVMGVVNQFILPAICEKHPRALPENFHNELIDFGGIALQTNAEGGSLLSGCHLYERFVRSETDAVMPGSPHGDFNASELLHQCEDDKQVLVRLLKISWQMQAAKNFICSDIMDIRTIGIMSLRHRLVDLYNSIRRTPRGMDHPVIQYAVRFLRQNEITGYIFGPESRAGLVSHSADIVCFLAATSTYTDMETDIMWRACSTSVEADFVKASFHVLRNLLPFLDFGHLMYLARKYSNTPLDRIGSDAIEFLQDVLKALEAKVSAFEGTANQLAVAFTSIEILKAVNLSERSFATDRLRHLTMTEISRFAQPGAQPEQRAEIYKLCIPEVQKHTQHATTAVEVLTILLNVRVPNSEAEQIIAMLPVSAAVEELCSFVQRNKKEHIELSSISGAIYRLGCIARLMSFAPNSWDTETHNLLFDHAFGDSALCNAARNDAWTKLNELASHHKPSSAATSLWQGFMQDQVPSLDVNLTTPKLIEFISVCLKAEFANERIRSDPTQLLQLPLWKTLVRFATTSGEVTVVNMATGVVLDLLLTYPGVTTIAPALVAKCQSEFIRMHIKDLRGWHAELMESRDPSNAGKLIQGLCLLGALLAKSKDPSSSYALAKEPDLLLLGGADDKSGYMDFTAEVYGPEAHPKLIVVRAAKDTKVSELVKQLPEKTGAAVHRVIAGGTEISLVPERTLWEIGIRQSGVIMICPKYQSTLDLDKVLTSPGPVEQEILAQYDSIESFLDGPENVASKVYSFLKKVRLSAQSRVRISSPDATIQDLFPQDRPWRSAFSITILLRHLWDFSRLGVVDEGFVVRSIRLLCGVILEDSRPFQPVFISQVAQALLVFLRECPRSDKQTQFVEDASHFISRMNILMSDGINLPIEADHVPETGPVRQTVISDLYKALFVACEANNSLWSAFTQDANIMILHRQLLLDHDLALSSRIARIIKNDCQDTTVSRDVPNFLWHTLAPGLSDALQAGPASEVYFSLAIDVLHADQFTQANESSIRALIDALTGQLWSHRHQESTRFRIPDKAMAGLLRLLGVAITILKSYKKPLQLHGLSTHILRELLFPPLHGPNSHPLVHEETRNLAFEVARWSFEADRDLNAILDITLGATSGCPRDIGNSYPGHSEWCRPACNAAGLINLGMTCYMNSLLQQLFANLQFRKFILDQPVDGLRQSDVLVRVQDLFAQMQNNTCPMIDTSDLARTLDVQIGNQEDVHTFYTTLLSRLEDNISESKDKFALTKFFTGKSVTQIKGECGHVSSRMEPFTELSITVKNKASLQESLDEFVQGEPLEGANKYMCMTCDSEEGGRLVNAVRRTCLEEVPDNLTFCLKRFTYEAMMEGENKVNDRFEFPNEIDLSMYKRGYLEDPSALRETDEFELVGVIVHQGSLQYGHYWSYVRVPDVGNSEDSTWLYLEDNRFVRCANGIREVREQCFGGPKWPNGTERADSAYVLFYQRKSYIAQAAAMNIVPKHLQLQNQILPRVELPERLAIDIDKKNAWRRTVESLFTNQFSSFIVWLLGQFSSVLEARHAGSEEDRDFEQRDDLKLATNNDLEARLGELIAVYAMRILLADPYAEARVEAFLASFSTLLEACPTIAGHVLRYFSTPDGFGFGNTVLNKSVKVRYLIFGGIERCMSILRERDSEAYTSLFPLVIDSHAAVIGPVLDAAPGQWSEYFTFAANLAGHGHAETGHVLNNDYLKWIFEILYSRWDQDSRKKHEAVYKWTRTHNYDLSSLFHFVYRILSEYVYLSEDYRYLPLATDQRTSTPHGWLLRQDEAHRLFCKPPGNKLWMLFLAANQNCVEPADWQMYAPGKLLGLLVGGRPNAQFLRLVEDFLPIHYDFEENHLMPLLYMTLHFCQNRPDHECRGLLKQLSKNLLLWQDFEKDVIWFFNEACDLAPVSVMDSVPIWAERFLRSDRLSIRPKTVKWLQDSVFEPLPLSDNPALDAARIRCTRLLYTQLSAVLRQEYHTEQGRTPCEHMIQALEQAKTYLTVLHSEVIKRQVDGGAPLRPEILVEHGESRAVLAGVAQLLDELSGWEPETALPTRLHEVRKSVEIDSEDGETSDAEGDDLSSDNNLS